jgi:hypothetical protein
MKKTNTRAAISVARAAAKIEADKRDRGLRVKKMSGSQKVEYKTFVKDPHADSPSPSVILLDSESGSESEEAVLLDSRPPLIPPVIDLDDDEPALVGVTKAKKTKPIVNPERCELARSTH